MPEHDGPIPFYPTLACHLASLREGHTPLDGCGCRVCLWARERAAGEIALDHDGPVRPGTPAWGALLALAGVPA